MAYKYFSEQLLSSGIDLSDVFPEKQDIARENNNVSYNLVDIVMYIKDVTNNFKETENQYIDLDNAISEIIAKWYKSRKEKNPFIKDLDTDSALEEFSSTSPREAAIVEKGDIKSKGAPASAPSLKKPKEPKVEPAKEQKVLEPELTNSEKIEKFKADLNRGKQVYELLDETEQAEYIVLLEKRLIGAELMAEDGDEYLVQRFNILKDFITSYK